MQNLLSLWRELASYDGIFRLFFIAVNTATLLGFVGLTLFLCGTAGKIKPMIHYGQLLMTPLGLLLGLYLLVLIYFGVCRIILNNGRKKYQNEYHD